MNLIVHLLKLFGETLGQGGLTAAMLILGFDKDFHDPLKLGVIKIARTDFRSISLFSNLARGLTRLLLRATSQAFLIGRFARLTTQRNADRDLGHGLKTI